MILVVDGNNIAFRSFAAMQVLKHNGMGTGAIYGTLRTLYDFIKSVRRPSSIYVVWDGPGETWRRKLYPQYKANRAEKKAEQGFDMEDFHAQTNALRRGLSALGVSQVCEKGVEADDLIWMLVEALRSDLRVSTVLSSDKDFYQLLAQNVSVYDGKNYYTYAQFKLDFGLEPEQWPFVRALMGDKSDNIPGIHGIGIKNAVKIVQKFKSTKTFAKATPDLLYTPLEAKAHTEIQSVNLYERLSCLHIPDTEVARKIGKVIAHEAVRGFKCGSVDRADFVKFCRTYGLESINPQEWCSTFALEE